MYTKEPVIHNIQYFFIIYQKVLALFKHFIYNRLRFKDGFPSGQRGQTVNLLATLSKVRILLHPSKGSDKCLNLFFINFLL
jgi:hypothetical protein